MIRRIVNLPFKVLGKVARAVQERQQEADRQRAEELTRASRSSQRDNLPALDVPADFATEDISVDRRQAEDLMRQDRDVLIIDVRSKEAFQRNHIADAINMPMGRISLDLAELPALTRFITVCADGTDSRLAARFLRYRGLDESYYLRGGVHSWDR
ncbi:MAG: rhodanese-like domain-containing protein [Myxococcota bacterium]